MRSGTGISREQLAASVATSDFEQISLYLEGTSYSYYLCNNCNLYFLAKKRRQFCTRSCQAKMARIRRKTLAEEKAQGL